MRSLPCELWMEIYSFLKPIGNLDNLKYKMSSLWCTGCGEIIVSSDWFLFMSNDIITLSCICENCLHENIFNKDDDWTTLVDYLNKCIKD